MGLQQKLTQFFGAKNNEIKASAAAPLLVQFGSNQAKFTPRQYDRLAEEAYQKNVIAYRCIRLISQNAASVPWLLYQGKKQLLDHPLLELLKRPNPMQSGSELFESLYGFFLIAGNSYVEAIGPDESAPQELWSLRPDRLKVVPGKSGVPEAYKYTVNGKSVDFKIDHIHGHAPVLHVKSFHPLNDWYGMSPLEAAAFSIDQHNEAAKWNASLLQNSGRPSGALIYKPANPDANNTLTEEQRRTLKLELEHHFEGSSNSGRPLVLEGGLDWREMSLNPKDMDWIAGKDVSAREIALAFNIPAQLVGVEGSLTYANFEQARLALYDDAVLPLLTHFKEEFNNWLTPVFGDDLRLDFDKDAIEALAPRREKIWERLNKSNFMTVNEKRAAVGLEPIENGDKL